MSSVDLDLGLCIRIVQMERSDPRRVLSAEAISPL